MSVFSFIKGRYLSLLITAIILHGLLAFFAPDPNGYVWDFYSDAIIWTYEHGKLPATDDCWVCYHPPLLPIVGVAIFKLTSLFSSSIETQLFIVASFLNLISLIFAIFTFAIYRIFKKHSELDLVLWGLILFLPVRFISSFAIESDMLVSTFIVISLYYFVLFIRKDRTNNLYISAVFISLAMLTKYTGLVIALIYGGILLAKLIKNCNRSNIENCLKYTGVVLLIGSFPYINNIIDQGNPIQGNKAWSNNHGYYTYNFKDFSIPQIIDVFNDDRPIKLRHYYQYNSEVLNSLYGQLWTDFSFFTIAYRHGQHEKQFIYQGKYMPTVLLWGILVAGLIPVIAGITGFCVLVFQKDTYLLSLVFLISIAVYTHWFMGHNFWMLKTKYLLYLLPVWLISINLAGNLIKPIILQKLLLPSVFLSFLYCFFFAVF